MQQPATLKSFDLGQVIMRILSGAAAEPKPDSKGEDAYFIHSDWIGVADGVGSCKNSGEYSQQLMASCMQILASEPGAKDEHKGLLKVMARANKKTSAVSSSTVVLAGGLADGKNILHVANMGDSACLVIRNGKVLARTTPQLEAPNCPYQICNENDPEVHLLGRCTDLGQVLKVPVQLGDIVVCATDGLWDSVTEEQVVLVSSTVIRDGASPRTVAGILLILSIGGWKPDDITIVVSLVVDDSTAQVSDEYVWARKFFRCAPQEYDIYDSQSLLLRILKMGSDERCSLGLVPDDSHFKLKLKLIKQYWEEWRKPQKPKADLELPCEIKQVLDDYACGKLKLPTFEDTELVSCEDGKPSLLLSHLPDGLNIETQKLEHILKTNPLVMLVGGRGSGKTKMLYTYLCSEGGGLYFTARGAEEHWGSADLDYLVKEVVCSIRPKRPQGRRRYCSSSSFESSYTVKSGLELLLVARMKIYDYCKDKMSNTQWLVLQAACRALVDSDGVCVGEAGDVFKAFLAHLCRHEEIPDVSISRMTVPICVIDDIEQCRMALHGCFTEAGDVVGLGFARALADFFETLRSKVVFSGACTHRDLLHGDTWKSFKIPQLFAKGCWKNADEAIQYSAMVLGHEMDKETADFVRSCVFERFKGRFTPFVTMLEVNLAKGLGLRASADYVERGYTTEEGVPGITNSFFKRIADSQQTCQAYIGWCFFERTVLGAKPCVVSKSTERYCCDVKNELFEWGFTRLADSNDGATICDEYLVLKAYQNMHGIMSVDWMHPVVPKVTLPLGVESIVNYDLVPFCMLRMWKEYRGVLQDMPVFAELLQAEDCPLQLKCMSKLQSAFLVDDGNCVSPEMKLDEFFSEEQALNRRFLFWCTEDYSSASAAGKIVVGDAPGTRVGYFHHVHHPEKRIWSSDEVVVVEDETPVKLEPGVDWAEQQAIPDIYFCFVIFHPQQSLNRLPYKWSFKEVAPGKLKVTVVLGMENMELVFTKEEVDVLKEVSNQKSSERAHRTWVQSRH